MPDKKPLKLILQYMIPHHPYSRLMGWLTHCEWPWLKNYLISLFIRRYQVDMNDAATNDPYQFKNFNNFFTRALKEGARRMPLNPSVVVSPVDGAIIECRAVEENDLVRIKGQKFNLHELLGGDSERTAPFIGGDFISLYLAPRDYHRVHMPITGKLREMAYIPGKLFSVNPLTTQHIPNVLARNERVVSIFDTEIGPVAVILVGAMIVASMETVWAGVVAPAKTSGIQTWRYDQTSRVQPILQRGEEMGRFQFGSTVVVLFAPHTLNFAEDMRADAPVQLGQALGTLKTAPTL